MGFGAHQCTGMLPAQDVRGGCSRHLSRWPPVGNRVGCGRKGNGRGVLTQVEARHVRKVTRLTLFLRPCPNPSCLLCPVASFLGLLVPIKSKKGMEGGREEGGREEREEGGREAAQKSCPPCTKTLPSFLEPLSNLLNSRPPHLLSHLLRHQFHMRSESDAGKDLPTGVFSRGLITMTTF